MGFDPDLYDAALRFATAAHTGQKVKGSDLPYSVHFTIVSMETIRAIRAEPVALPDLAVQCALLHDVVEDTDVTIAQVSERFGADVAAGVDALSKDPAVEASHGKEAALFDSVRRIREQPPEIWMVKLADRVANMAPPPHFWTADKRRSYRSQAGLILAQLGSSSPWLAGRLQAKIDGYGAYIT